MTDQELIFKLKRWGSLEALLAADRIEELVSGVEGLGDAFAEMAVKREAAEAKLAKAVEMLILCGDMFDEVAHPSDPLSVMIKTTLAELEGKE